MYKFSLPTKFSEDKIYLDKLFDKSENYSSDGKYYSLSKEILTKQTDSVESFLTPSGTSALEMMAQIIEINPGDEVIIPSYTFSSSAMAFINMGAKIVFVDIDPETGCISVNDVKSNINKKTRAILSVAYGGRLSNQLDLYNLAKENSLLYLEDNAQAIGNIGINKSIKPIADLSSISFHSTKNINSGGEGGAMLINNDSLIEKAWQVRDKGTNRQDFLSGKISKYQWASKGGSHILNEPSSAILASQLNMVDKVNKKRNFLCKNYKNNLLKEIDGFANILFSSKDDSNGHLFALILKDPIIRNKFLKDLSKSGVQATSHYEPLHTSPAKDLYKCKVSRSGCVESVNLASKIVRLPLHYELSTKDVKNISNIVLECKNKFI